MGDEDETRLARFVRSQDGVVTWQQLRLCGVGEAEVRRRLRSGRWARLRRGAYLIDADREQGRGATVQARAVSLTTPGGVLAGGTAAALWGIHGAPEGAVEVVLPPTRPLRHRPDMRPHTWALSPADVTTLRGMRVTSPARTLLDLVPTLDRPSALAVVDSALRSRVVVPADLARLRDTATGRPGAAHVADLWLLADGRAESVLESRVRLRCIDGGLPPDDLQVEVHDLDGRVLARGDMAYRTRSSRRRPGLLLVEADGAAVHARPEAVLVDRTRGNVLTALGHDVVRFTWRDTVDPHRIPRLVRAAR